MINIRNVHSPVLRQRPQSPVHNYTAMYKAAMNSHSGQSRSWTKDNAFGTNNNNNNNNYHHHNHHTNGKDSPSQPAVHKKRRSKYNKSIFDDAPGVK